MHVRLLELQTWMCCMQVDTCIPANLEGEEEPEDRGCFSCSDKRELGDPSLLAISSVGYFFFFSFSVLFFLLLLDSST